MHPMMIRAFADEVARDRTSELHERGARSLAIADRRGLGVRPAVLRLSAGGCGCAFLSTAPGPSCLLGQCAGPFE
jgi:hypothetical protein